MTKPSMAPCTIPAASTIRSVARHAGRVETVAEERLYLREATDAEFFAGIGLMRLGLERAGWRSVWANDIDPKKRALYIGAFGADEGIFQLDDVFALDAASLPTVTLATASFPCVDLSLAGGRAGLAGKASSAFWGFARDRYA